MSILIFLAILLVLVLVHEFGHFFSAKKFGIRVDEFGFGFPPKIYGVKKGETEYSVNALPFGGFVKIFGETPDEASISGPDAARSFVNKPKWQQAIVLFAGIFANLLLGWLLFSIGFMSGLPTSVGSELPGGVLKDVNLVIIAVDPGSPASSAGLKSGDKVMSLSSGTDTLSEVNPDNLKSFVVSHPDETIDMAYERGKSDTILHASVTPKRSAPEADPVIGISMDQVGIEKLPVLPALWQGLRYDWMVTRDTAVGFYNLIAQALAGHGSLSEVTGPVGLVGIVGDVSRFGFVYLLSFTALISVNLAVINLIPFPALDGGRLLFLLIEKIKGSPIKPKVANIANMAGFALLILLMLVVTYHDIAKLVIHK